MTYAYTIEGVSNTVTVTGETSTFANITYGEENSFEFYIKGGSDPEGNYNTLKEYQKYAGYTQVDRTLGDVFYHVTTDFSRSEIDSLVVKITPGESIDQARGVWGVITDIEDNTEIFGAIARVDVTVAVLADATEYDSHSEISDTFESNL